jgi:hypothetical protein
MKIACIGWGSLIWEPNELGINSEWYIDGPLLPIEFARQSTDGRITLVIEEKSIPVRTLWCYMTASNLNEAIESLRKREKTNLNYIHFQTLDSEPKNKIHAIVFDWLREKKIECAIWTGLPPKFNDVNNIKPTLNELLNYLEKADTEILVKCSEYILKAPRQINTKYRKDLEYKLKATDL